MPSITTLPYLFLRAPMLSMDDYSINNVSKLLTQQDFQFALYLASPSYFKQLEASNFDDQQLTEKQRTTVIKYFNRFCYRSTPFGAFSSFTRVEGTTQKQNGDIELSDQIHYDVRADEIIIGAINNLFDRHPFQQAKIGLNSTLYKLGRNFRYLTTTWEPKTGKAVYSLASLKPDALFTDLFRQLNKEHKTGLEIVQFLIQRTSCSVDEASAYLQSMLDDQILQPVIGHSLLNDHDWQILKQASNALLAPLNEDLSILAGSYGELHGQLAQLFEVENLVNRLFTRHKIPIPAQHFCVTSIREARGSLPPSINVDLEDMIDFLYKLQLPAEQPILTDFINRFSRRFELQEVPLLTALDPDSGILYGQVNNADEDHLLADLPALNTPKVSTQVTWTALHRRLIEKWLISGGRHEVITLDENDLPAAEDRTTDSLPPSIPVMFSLIGNQILVEAAGGISALSLIGRFTPSQLQTWQAAKEIADLEIVKNPGVIFAEISLLSDRKVDNINRRKPLFDYEILINAAPSGGNVTPIHLTDLSIFIQDQQVVLWSRSLQKQVIPRLCTAYNPLHHDLGLFRLLCALQYQGVQSSFLPDPTLLFPELSYYPRIAYKRTILFLARWHLQGPDLKQWQKGKSSEMAPQFNLFRIRLHIPAVVAWSKGDQQLVFDFNDSSEIIFFLDCIKNEPAVVLKEYLGKTSSAVTNKRNNPMAHQFIAVFHADAPTYREHSNRTVDRKIKRSFVPGSSWIYFKLYCVPSQANHILVQKIYPIIHKYHTQEFTNWFFVRYSNSAHHIRIRFQIKNDNPGLLLRELREHLAGEVDAKLIHEYQTDTYKRELERYGSEMMTPVEMFFTASSNLVLQYLKRRNNDTSYLYYATALIDTQAILLQFFPLLQDRIDVAKQMAETFLSEHQDYRKVKIALDKKYRSLHNEVSQILDPTAKDQSKRNLLRRHAQFLDSVKYICINSHSWGIPRRIQLAADLIHMHLNRIFSDHQRYQELVIYYCIYKFLLYQRAKDKQN